MIMKNEIKFILPLIIFMLFYSGCSIKNVNDNYVIANIPVPSLGMKFLLFKGSSNLHKQRTYFITHIDSIDKANYPNPFSPMQDLEIRMFKADSVKIELLNGKKMGSISAGDMDALLNNYDKSISSLIVWLYHKGNDPRKTGGLMWDDDYDEFYFEQ